MFYIRKINGNDEFRPVAPYYGTTWYEQRGWMLYSGNLPQSRVTIEGGTQGEDGITRRHDHRTAGAGADRGVG
jgi:hypothetical protein